MQESTYKSGLAVQTTGATSKGRPGGHKKWAFVNADGLNEQYSQQLAALGLTDTIVAGVTT